MRFKFKNHKFTLMFIPHNNATVRSVKIPAILINSLAVLGLVSLIVVSVMFVKSAKLEEKVMENDTLKIVNSIQSEEIRNLKEETVTALKMLEEIRTTDARIREMVGLEVKTDNTTSDDSRITASRGSGGAEFPSRSLGVERYDLMSTTYTSEASRNDTKTTYGLEDISEIKQMLSEINEGIVEQDEVLTTLEKETSDRLRFLAAKPQGWPSSGRITSGYGWRVNPFTRRGSEFHSGIDIANSYGTRINSTGSGRVTFAGWRAGYGYTVMINHGYGYTTMYAHLASINVRVGDSVERGQMIGRMGRTGRATGVHLHYEVTFNGRTINPRDTI